MKKSIQKGIFFLIIYFFNFSLSAEQTIIEINTSRIPYIEKPESKNLVFRQFIEDADYNTKKNKKDILYTFYKLHVPQNMDFLWLSSRLSPVYKDTIATLNRLSSADFDIAEKDIIICSFSGLFIPELPLTNWEMLLHKEFISGRQTDNIKLFIIDGKKFFFLEDERFDSTTYLFFLDTNMISPLKSKVLTSNYGYRVSPISGKWKFHSGIDLAAPEGSDVFACKAGEVSQTGFNSTYGNYIIILHYNGMTSVYAHLSEILTEKGKKINGGALIGKVGTTGASTGPHLHFEIRKNGNPTDPGKLINF